MSKKINTNSLVAELMSIPRPNRRRVQEILRIIYNEGVQEQKRRVLHFFRIHRFKDKRTSI